MTNRPNQSIRIDESLVRQLLVRLMLRNERDPVKRRLDGIQFSRNIESIGAYPEHHLAVTMQIIEKNAAEGKSPPFETGLMFGVAMALTSRSTHGKQMLHQMLRDIEAQQRLQDEVREELNELDPQPQEKTQ